MKKMKTTILTSVALAACVSTQLFAQTVVKQDTITISLTGAKQSSVSTSASVPNFGNWSTGPMFYKTAPIKVTDKDIIKYIAASLWGNANHYSTKAKLVLVQGELSGFFNITPDLALSMPDDDGIALDPYFSEAPGFSADGDINTSLANSFDSTTVQLANGRHWDVNPYVPTMYPVGHLQPWGQIYIQDDSTSDNVTFYFAISIQECYDCFYLNSFISTATFKTQNTAPNGPPCCVGTSVIVGSGKDAYYMTFSFDNTRNNPYLYNNPSNPLYFGDEVGNNNVDGVPGAIDGDAIVPDTIYRNSIYVAALAGGATVAEAQLAAYIDSIKAGVGVPAPYQARFTLNGVLTYTWKLAQIDKQDISPDFMGTGSYVANGYGFIALSCSLFNTATITFSEKPVKANTVGLVTGEDWAADWIGIGAEYYVDAENLNETTPYANWVAYGSPTYQWGFGENQYGFGNGYPTPINVTTSLSYHENFNNQYPAHFDNPGWAAWPTPAYMRSYWRP
jgi:hypothetical protein